jgi:hypothetical protein
MIRRLVHENTSKNRFVLVDKTVVMMISRVAICHDPLMCLRVWLSSTSSATSFPNLNMPPSPPHNNTVPHPSYLDLDNPPPFTHPYTRA